MGVGARGRACSTARQENFVGIAFRDRCEHHERFWLNFRRAFAGLNAFSGIISEHSLFARASGFADTRAQGVGIFARAIATFALTEFFIFLALLDFNRFRLDLSNAFAGLNAFTGIVTEKALFASAARNADTWADRIRVLAGSIASFALTVFFIFLALLDRWEHHERLRLELSRAFTGFNAFTGIVTEMTLFAGAAGNADTWADRVGVLARTIASFALTVFFVIATHRGLHGHSFGGRYAASFRMNADAVFVFQESGFAEATNDAIASADRARVGIGAGGRASGSACKEHFVVFALRKFWWISKKLHGFNGIALSGRHANAASISQMTFFAEASDDAVLGTNRARVRIGAGGGAR